MRLIQTSIIKRFFATVDVRVVDASNVVVDTSVDVETQRKKISGRWDDLTKSLVMGSVL